MITYDHIRFSMVFKRYLFHSLQSCMKNEQNCHRDRYEKRRQQHQNRQYQRQKMQQPILPLSTGCRDAKRVISHKMKPEPKRL